MDAQPNSFSSNTSAKPETRHHHREKVVVIDDEHDICYLLATMLRKFSCDVKIATSLSKGLVEISNTQPSVAFLDINFPDGSSGLECIHMIKLCSPKTQVIMMSAADGIAERQKAKREGASYFISKPFNEKIIAKALKEVTH